MKKIILGMLIGFILSFSTTSLGAVKQYVLYEINYPVFVNGVEYKSSEFPFLNYDGRTYVPLSKLGDLTGLNYKWNDELKRVEIYTEENNKNVSEEITSNNLYAVNGKGEYSDYLELKGYPNENSYRIFFKGESDSYMVAIEDLREINLNEIITWEYDGETYTHTREELYVFFSDTTWFNNISDYTLTHEWFVDTFGDVYLEWAVGIDYSNEAVMWVEEYFRQTGQVQSENNIQLTPDAEFEIIDIYQ